MRCHRCRPNGTVFLWYFCTILPASLSIMVPTGKETPIEPAEKLPSPTVAPSARHLPAPVYEYTAENPEPPPLDPSYVPIHFNYIQYLTPHAIVYVPMQLKTVSYVQKLPDRYKQKYEKNPKVAVKVLQKYQDYPVNLQKKYYHYFLTQSNKA